MYAHVVVMFILHRQCDGLSLGCSKRRGVCSNICVTDFSWECMRFVDKICRL